MQVHQGACCYLSGYPRWVGVTGCCRYPKKMHMLLYRSIHGGPVPVDIVGTSRSLSSLYRDDHGSPVLLDVAGTSRSMLSLYRGIDRGPVPLDLLGLGVPEVGSLLRVCGHCPSRRKWLLLCTTEAPTDSVTHPLYRTEALTRKVTHPPPLHNKSPHTHSFTSPLLNTSPHTLGHTAPLLSIPFTNLLSWHSRLAGITPARLITIYCNHKSS